LARQSIRPASFDAGVADLTLNPVTNDSVWDEWSGFDISSIFIDPHDATGKTVYVTVEGDCESI
jgi:hypothetical protein